MQLRSRASCSAAVVLEDLYGCLSQLARHSLHSFPHATALAGVGLKFGRHLCRNERCLHCGDHISRPCGNAGGWHCDECFVWWKVQTIYWRLWSVMQTRHSDNLAADICRNTGLGLRVCSFLAPSRALVVRADWLAPSGARILSLRCERILWRQLLGPSDARDMSLSIAAKLRGEQLKLNACSSVLLRMATEFVNDPEYICVKGFCIVTCDTLWHLVKLPELSHQSLLLVGAVFLDAGAVRCCIFREFPMQLCFRTL